MATAPSTVPSRSPDSAVGEVRPFRRADAPDVAALWRRCFRFDRLPPPDALQAVVADVFLDNPWRQPDVPSLVATDARGVVFGFLGVVPRPMRLDGVPLRAAVSTRFMVEPGRRGLAALRLLQTFFAGPQDLSIADFATGASRALWDRLGGTAVVPYSLEWFRPVAPARAALGWLAHVRRSPTLGLVARTLGRLVDIPLTRVPGSPFRGAATRWRSESLSDAELFDVIAAWTPERALHACYTAETLSWLIGMLRRKLGGLRCARVYDGGDVIGWYVYGRERELAQVAALDWRPGRFGDVQQQLLADAAADGAAAVCGRVPPRLLAELDDRLCVLRRAPWVLVHTRLPAVRDAIARGDAVLSRMDGEWWIPP